MSIYKVIFANNTISTCHPINEAIEWIGEYYYEHSKGKLIYAMVKAENETDAMGKCDLIIKKFIDFLS